METAIGDSKNFEILSFEEVEQLKKERAHLRNRVEGTRRKIALESKLRDAAQSLNRLYSTRSRPGNADTKSDGQPTSPRKQRKSFLGGRSSLTTTGDALSKADDEFMASSRKVEELTQELAGLGKQLEETDRRILEHTAGILQMTHKGLKKNIRKMDLPRSPESMNSQNRTMGFDGVDEFDERSLYQIPDYVNEFGQMPSALSVGKRRQRPETQAIDDVAYRLSELNQRLHAMILQAGPQEHFEPPPHPDEPGLAGRIGAQIQANIGYMAQGLDAIEAAQARTIAEAQKSMFDSEDQLEDVNVRLHDMLELTNTDSHSPLLPFDATRGKDMQSQFHFSNDVLDRLNSRIETIVEQKDILSHQIHQQRELNNKSDEQQDEIRNLTKRLEEAKHLQNMGEQEAQHARDQLTLLMEQLDQTQHNAMLQEQQRGMSDDSAIEAERQARAESEERLLASLHAKHEEHQQLLADMSKLRNEVELRSQHHNEQLNELTLAKEAQEIEVSRHRAEVEKMGEQLSNMQAEHDGILNRCRVQIRQLDGAKEETELELAKARGEIEELESETVRMQTELTIVKAELDGAYGSRAQRAADVSSNPAVQKEIDSLNARNGELQQQLDLLSSQHVEKGADSAELQNKVNTLQTELKETIEEYEMMTKASIEFERERDHLEASIDSLRDRCEALETQLSEERVKWLGVKASAPAETTSTMVLKNEFKKMMRDTRSENIKSLRVCDIHGHEL